MVIEGEAGIGKTRLAEELLAYAQRRGAPVLAGRAYEEEAGLAYGPLVEALQARVRDSEGWVEARRAADACRGGRAGPRARRSAARAARAPAARRTCRPGALLRRRVGDARGGRGRRRAVRRRRSNGPTMPRSPCSRTGCAGSIGARRSCCSRGARRSSRRSGASSPRRPARVPPPCSGWIG